MGVQISFLEIKSNLKSNQGVTNYVKSNHHQVKSCSYLVKSSNQIIKSNCLNTPTWGCSSRVTEAVTLGFIGNKKENTQLENKGEAKVEK